MFRSCIQDLYLFFFLDLSLFFCSFIFLKITSVQIFPKKKNVITVTKTVRVFCNCIGLSIWSTELLRSSNARLTSFYINFYIVNKKIYSISRLSNLQQVPILATLVKPSKVVRRVIIITTLLTEFYCILQFCIEKWHSFFQNNFLQQPGWVGENLKDIITRKWCYPAL